MGQNERNVSIQLIRIVAMFMIVTDHMIHYCNIPMKSMIMQLTNSGVFIFLFISGYLFGNKKIDNWGKWFLKRGLRIFIPYWVFLLIYFIVEEIVWQDVGIKEVLIYSFNLQGIFGTRSSTNPLWFLTLIMICYLLTPILSKFKRSLASKKIAILLVVVYFITQMIIAYYYDAGLIYGHTIGWCMLAFGVYGIAFFIGDRLLFKEINIKKELVVTIVVIACSGIIIILRNFLDGRRIYMIIMWYGMGLVDYWIICTLNIIGQTRPTHLFKTVIDYLDSISYEFYLVHGVIVFFIVYLSSNSISIVPFIAMAIIFSLIGATLIHFLSKPIIRIIKKRLEKNV